jgi:hypothetical protein
MKKIILIMLFLSLIGLGKETIMKPMTLTEYTNTELVSNTNQHNKFNLEDKVNCSQCHGCKMNTDTDYERDNLDLLRANTVELDTITNIKKDLKLKQLKS